MKKNVSILTLSIFIVINVLVFSGCSMYSNKKQPLVYPENLPALGYTFDYIPIKEPNSVMATLALIAPTYNNSNSSDISFTFLDDSITLVAMNNDQIKKICDEYLNSIKSDFNETLISKGYTLLGPFSDITEMTYGEKEKSNLVLFSKLNLKFQFLDTVDQNQKKFELFSNTSETVLREVYGKKVLSNLIRVIAKYSGELIVDGFIELVLVEPLTGEKMWIKQIKVPFEKEPYYYYILQEGMQDVDILGTPVGNLFITNTKLIKDSDFRPRSLAKALEKVYTSQLDFFSKYFDPKEISFVIKDAEKIRKLKRY